MFGLISKSAHDRVIRKLNERHREEVAKLQRKAEADEITIDALDRTAKKYRADHAAVRAQLQPFLDRQAKAKQNLRQYRKPSDGAEAAGKPA